MFFILSGQRKADYQISVGPNVPIQRWLKLVGTTGTHLGVDLWSLPCFVLADGDIYLGLYASLIKMHYTKLSSTLLLIITSNWFQTLFLYLIEKLSSTLLLIINWYQTLFLYLKKKLSSTLLLIINWYQTLFLCLIEVFMCCMYACIYVCMYVCTYARVYVCMHACMYVCMYVLMYVCTHVCMHVCMYVWMYVCMYVCMYVYMHVCMNISQFVCIYAYMYASMYVKGCMYECMYTCMYVCMHVYLYACNFENANRYFKYSIKIQKTSFSHQCHRKTIRRKKCERQ